MQNFDLARGKPWYQMPSYEDQFDTGSIGKVFEFDEWKASQAWQAFSTWESMKWQRLRDIDGIFLSSLKGGANNGTNRQAVIDEMGHAKLGYYIHQMVFQDVVAGSNNTDVIYHKRDLLTPVIFNVGDQRMVRLKVTIKSVDGEIVDSRDFDNVLLEKGRTVKEIPSFRPKFSEEGYYIIEYFVLTPSPQTRL
jgi:hypothetical protein